MRQAMKSEFRKLLSVRSTYLLSGLALLLVVIASFYGQGFKAGVYDSHFFTSDVTNTAMAISFFGAIVSILLMAHEYRYNTITYSLTLNKSRSKVLVAKIIAVLTYTVVLTTVALSASIGLSVLGASLAGHHLPHQDFNALLYLGKSIFYCGGFALAGLLLTTLIRNLTASIVALFIVPNTVETLLGLWLKGDSQYLPFTSLQTVLSPITGGPGANNASAGHGVIVFLAYLIPGWIIAWWLFLRRDAN